MRSLLRNRRGATALEMSLIALPFFMLLFGIFDIGRYSITVNSLKTLAGTVAREVMISCYFPDEVSGQSPAGCTTNPLTTAQQEQIAPFLYVGGLTPTVTITSGGGALTVTASQPDFRMIWHAFWSGLDSPSVSTKIPL